MPSDPIRFHNRRRARRKTGPWQPTQREILGIVAGAAGVILVLAAFLFVVF